MNHDKTFKIHLNDKEIASEADGDGTSEWILKQARLGLTNQVFRTQTVNNLLTIIPEFGFEDAEIDVLSKENLTPAEWAGKFIQLLLNRNNLSECLNILCNLHQPKYGQTNYQLKIVQVFNAIPNVSVREVAPEVQKANQPNPEQPDGKILSQTGSDSELIVGNPPCTLNEVCNVLSKPPGAGSLFAKLDGLARDLNFPEGQIGMILMWVATKMRTQESVLYDILQEWRSFNSSNAKLSTLIGILEAKGLKDSADALRQRFNV